MNRNMNAKEVRLNQLDGCKLSHFALALACVGLATLIRFPFEPVFGNTSPFFFYFPVVLAIAIAYGLKPGLLATAASIIPANYFWMGPLGFDLDVSECWQILAFWIAGTSVSWLSETARQRKKLEEHLRATLATMADAIITTDCSGTIVYLNGMAQVLTELHGQEAIGSAIGSALNILDAEHPGPLNAALQMAVRDDEIEKLPKRVIIVSKTGRCHSVEQTGSRIIDAHGRRLGTAILFHPTALEAKPIQIIPQ